MLAAAGHVCYSLDFPGHGASPGVRGLVREPAHLTDDGLVITKFAHSQHPSLPLVLFGTSMGGAIALNVARRCSKEQSPKISTCVLCAPMLGIAQQNIPPPWQVTALRFLTAVAPSLALLSSNATDNSLQFRDPVRREECTNDELTYKGNLRLATACSCMDTATELSANLNEVDVPFLCLVAGKEVVVEKDAYKNLMDQSSTQPQHKKAVLYPEALHGLFCEPLEERILMEKEILDWIAKYTS